jgi:dienelactone hydrolase
MNFRGFVFLLAISIGVSTLAGAVESRPQPWDIPALSIAPKTFEDPKHSTADIKAIYYEGLPWNGKPTRVFAYYGVPKLKAGEKAPAMVLVHGGGGSAYPFWVKLWVDRGYAAIAMDTCGCVHSGELSKHPRHEQGGPPGWDAAFDQIDLPIQDQWPYHAVADVILAHSLIRSLPQVDPEKTGITGISWGGYLTCIVAGVDARFKFAAPVYGCGFLGDNSMWLKAFQSMGPEKARRWLKQWDPSVYLPEAKMPFLWVTGSNDAAYPLDSLQKSYRLLQTPPTLCIRLRMPHGHGGAGENPSEIYAMAESIFRQGPGLARIEKSGREGRNAWATFHAPTPIVNAELNYTTDSGQWLDRNWIAVPAKLDPASGRVSAELPPESTVYYFNLINSKGLVVSTEHEALLPKRRGAKRMSKQNNELVPQ